MSHVRYPLVALFALVLGGADGLAGQEIEIPRVILIGIDGLGSGNVWRDTYNGVPAPAVPNIDRLRDSGAYTLRARIDPLNFSGPNWAGMVTGSISAEHGVDTNECTRGTAKPTIYEVLRDAFQQYRSRNVHPHRLAVIHEWTNIACYYDPSAVDFKVNTANERETADWVINAIGDENIIFTFVYFGDLDLAGHQSGGNSLEYNEKIEAIDAEIGNILTAIAESPRAASTYVILTADHGHLPDGGGHSSADAPVPFIVSGPAVAVGEMDADVRNNQVAPLVAHIFGAVPSPAWSATLAPFDRVVPRPSVVAIDVSRTGSNVVRVGRAYQFQALTSLSDGTSRDATFQAVWSSSDEAVFTISARGRGSAVSTGDAEVCATAMGVAGCLSVTVTADPPTNDSWPSTHVRSRDRESKPGPPANSTSS
jgi:hypothetical protein